MFPSGAKLPGTVLQLDGGDDCSILSIPSNTEPKLVLAQSDATVGQQVWVSGYGPYQDFAHYAVSTGTVSGFRADWVVVNGCSVREGDSGGPIFNSVGEVIGIIAELETSSRLGRVFEVTVSGPRISRLRQILNSLQSIPEQSIPAPTIPLPEPPTSQPTAVEPPAVAIPLPPTLKEPDSKSDIQKLADKIKADNAEINAGTVPVAKEPTPAPIETKPAEEPEPQPRKEKSVLKKIGQATAAGAEIASTVAGTRTDPLTILLMAAAGVTGIGVPAVAIYALSIGIRLWAKRRASRKHDEVSTTVIPTTGAGTTSGNFLGTRNIDEAKQYLKLANLEGRNAVLDALAGRIALDRLDFLLDASSVGESEKQYAGQLKSYIYRTIDKMAPLALSSQSLASI